MILHAADSTAQRVLAQQHKVRSTCQQSACAETQSPCCAGPVLLEDSHLLEKLAQFNRERIPERIVHARGMTAKGYFEVTGGRGPGRLEGMHAGTLSVGMQLC